LSWVRTSSSYNLSISTVAQLEMAVSSGRSWKIGKRCLVQSHSFICELVTIGDDCFISHGRCLSMIYSLRAAGSRTGLLASNHAWQSRERWDKRYNPPSHDLRRGSHRGRRSHHQRHYRARVLCRQPRPTASATLANQPFSDSTAINARGCPPSFLLMSDFSLQC
jgi:hypothetical protein